MDNNFTAQEIKDLRASLGMSQAEFAMKLRVALRTINRWEHGKSRPSQLAHRQLARLVK